MSDIMFYGVLRMPYEMAMADEISRLQFYQCAQEAANRLEKLEDEAQQPTCDRDAVLEDAALFVQAREALATGLDCAIEVQNDTTKAYAGYKPHKHEAAAADVKKIEDTIAAIDAHVAKKGGV